MSLYWQSTRATLQSCNRALSTTAITYARQPRPRFGLKKQPLSDPLDVTSPLFSFDAFRAALMQPEPEGYGLRRDLRAKRAEAARNSKDRMWEAVMEGKEEGAKHQVQNGRDSISRRSLGGVNGMNSFSWQSSSDAGDLESWRDVKLEKPAFFNGREAATVYVNNVPRHVGEDELRELFEEQGEIEEVIFPADSEGDFWDGYCQVRFKSPQSARNLAAHHVYSKENVSLLVRSSKHGPGEKPIYLGKAGSVVFVDGLPRDATQEQVRRVFRRFGPIEYVNIPRNIDGFCLRHGYVHFFEDDVIDSILQSTKYAPLKLRGRLLTVEARASFSKPRMPTRALFLGNVHKDVTKEAVVSLFKGITPIDVSNVSCPEQAPTNELNLIGSTAFVLFESTSEAQKVLDMHHLVPFEFKGHEIRMSFCDPPVSSSRQISPHSTLYMAGFGPEVEADDIKKAFKDFESHIKSVRIRRDPETGQSRRSAFLRMMTTDAAQNLLAHHKDHPIRVGDSGISLQYAKSQDEELPTRDLRFTEYGRSAEAVEAYLGEHMKYVSRINYVDTKSEGQAAFVRFNDLLYSVRAKEHLEGTPMSSGLVPVIKYGTSMRPGHNPLNAMTRRSTKLVSAKTEAPISTEQFATAQESLVEIPPTDRLLDESAQQSKVPVLDLNMMGMAKQGFRRPQKKKH